MKLIYPAVFHSEDESVWVEFPDLEGCQSFGDNVKEALDGAKEALEGYCITLLEEKRKLPEASDMLSIKTDKASFATLVEVDLTTRLAKQKSVKKTLTVPAWLNDMAVEKGINFSAVLQEGLVNRLGL
ncbi:MAG: type II toxin-antitoxin system HicB family antitoxin [Ruminiclostridium sp.]|nr:type II toxin-antitoxin system HicB family antitoxin [Ruminiclostridium sp.]